MRRRLRKTTVPLALVLACATQTAACGAGTHFANLPTPPLAVNLSVYVSDRGVSLSPTSTGAGPVSLLITNQATRTVALRITDAQLTQLASTGPIDPQATAQLTVDFRSPGDYFITTQAGSETQAQQAFGAPPAFQSASLRVGRPRASASDALLKP